jgi:glutamyl-tRNA synthetase
MGITHVIRAEEWIPSLPLHHELYKAFGWEEPVFAHMPLLRNKDKSKISKRKNPTSLLWYRDAGFLPEAMLNFLSLMGFSMPGDREKYAYPELLKEFSLDRINLGGPIFNLEKLVWLNGEYMRSMTPESLASRLVEFIARFKGRENDFPDLAEDELPKDDYIRKFEVKRRQNLRTLGVHAGAITSAPREQLLRIMPLIVERLHTLTEAADYLPMFFNDRFSYTRDDFTSKKTSHDQARKALAELHKLLAAFDFRDSDALAALDMRSRMLAEELGMKVGEFFGPARVAITGAKVSPPLIESMLVLGREATLARLERALAAL